MHVAVFVSLLKRCENSSPLFMINRVQVPSEIINFAMLPAQLLLARNSFICRCTSFNEVCHWGFGGTINFLKFPVIELHKTVGEVHVGATPYNN